MHLLLRESLLLLKLILNEAKLMVHPNYQKTFLLTSFKTAISQNWTINNTKSEETACDSSWRIGEKVMAVYYEDGITYRAKILQLKDWKKAVVVKFIDYGNEEEVRFGDLSKMDKKPSKKQKKRPIKKHRKPRNRLKTQA